MIDKEIMVLDDNDYKAIEYFQILGLPKILSKVLICIYNNINTSRDIEISANMRQPQVSIAIKKLMNYNYISIVNKVKSKRGRNTNVYNVNYALKDIMEGLEIMAYKEYTKKIDASIDIKNLYKIK